MLQRQPKKSVATIPPTRLSPVALAARLALAATLNSAIAASALAQTPADLDRPLKESITLQEVKVIGTAERGYAVKASATATKTDTLLIDTPQSITIVTKELMRDQAMQSMADVIRYVPGIVPSQGEGNRDTAIFRGNSSTSDFYLDGIRDDVQYFRDFYNIDSVEALKGSNAMIFGRGGSGGVINRVSKQPQWSPVREASLTLGSWNNRRVTADVGQVINSSAAFRVNGVYENSQSYREHFKLQRKGINPTLALRAGPNTSVVLGYEHFEDRRVADRGIPSFQGKPLDTDPSTFFGSPGQSPTMVNVDAFSALIEHDLGNGALLRNRTRYADYDKFYQNVFPGAVNPAGTLVALSAYNNATERTNLFNQTDLSFAFNTGSIKHKLSTGLELGRQVTDNLRNTGFFLTVGPATSSVLVPTANPLTDLPVTFKPSATDANNHGKATVASVYLQDQIEFSPQWQAIAGLRYDRFKVDFLNNRTGAVVSSTDTPVSPRVGLVYKPMASVSVYGSYSLAFVPRAGDQLSSLTASNKAFDPEQFKNRELGVKWDINPSLAATAAIYRLDRSNVAITDPLDPTKSILVDGQRSKGVELGISGNLSRDWSVMGGYAYQDAKITQTQSPTIRAGATLSQVPSHTFSLWNQYDFNPAWGAAVGILYRSSIFASLANTVTLPAFTRLDGAVYYGLNKNLKLQVNVENLFDKKYYAAANSNDNITPGAPRAIKLALHATF